MRTKYLPVKYRYLVEDKFESAGPKPCIRGLKKHFYGQDSICVMCGQYLYYLGRRWTAENRLIYNLAR